MLHKTIANTKDNTDIRGMENNNKEVQEVQGTEVQKKKQKPSATYTLFQMGEMILKLVELKLITEKQKTTLEEIRQQAKTEWIKTI